LLTGWNINVRDASEQLLYAIYSLTCVLNDTLPVVGMDRDQLCQFISNYAPVLRDSDKYSLLHMTVEWSSYARKHTVMSQDDDIIVDEDKLFKAFRMSMISFMSLLVQNKCGCLDVTNVEGDTALHILASYAVNNRVYGTTWSEDGVRDMAVECIQLLLASGAHRDVHNNARETPADILARSDNATVSSMMANYCPSLQCLAANVIRVLNLPLDDLPSHLKTFVLLH
jgi:hypothetical protein